MLRAVLWMPILLAGCGSPSNPQIAAVVKIDTEVRDECFSINAQMLRLLPNPQLLNCGSGLGDDSGDTLPYGLHKIVENLREMK